MFPLLPLWHGDHTDTGVSYRTACMRSKLARQVTADKPEAAQSNAVCPVLQSKLDGQIQATQPYKTAAEEEGPGRQHVPKTEARPPVPKLAVVLMCAGTRGDVQPFIALGLQLKVSSLRLEIFCGGLCGRLPTKASVGSPCVLSHLYTSGQVFYMSYSSTISEV